MAKPLDEQIFSFVQINVPSIAPIIQRLDIPVSYDFIRDEYQGIQFCYGFREGSMTVSTGHGSMERELYVYYVEDPRQDDDPIEYDGRRMITASFDRA